jgi:hypothetical protein
MKTLIITLCLVLLAAFSAVDVSARSRCGKVWIEGHYNRHGRWIHGHYKHLRWVPAYYDHHGRYIEGHCR